MRRGRDDFGDGGTFGLLIRLANDCELFESWSSGTYFCRCVDCPAGLRRPDASRVVPERRVEYEAEVGPGPCEDGHMGPAAEGELDREPGRELAFLRAAAGVL